MAKARIFDLPITKGIFNLKGVVFGTEKDTFYKQQETKNHLDFRMVNFGVKCDNQTSVYVGLNGMPQENVYFYKNGNKKTGTKGETIKVPWTERYTFNNEGFRLIGKNIGITKTVDKKGNTVNDKKNLTDFDACKYISEKLTDGDSIFIQGNVEYGSYYTDKNEKRRTVRLIPNQISLCEKIDFSKEDFKAENGFNQVIIFMGIDKEEIDEKDTGRFVLSAKIVNYSTIEDAEFIVENSSFANTLRKNLKPYTAIKVWGIIKSEESIEEVNDDDVWGEKNPITKINAPTRREFVITGGDNTSVDEETYSKELVEEAIASINNAKNAENDFSGGKDNDTWGDQKLDDSDSSFDDAWD